MGLARRTASITVMFGFLVGNLRLSVYLSEFDADLQTEKSVRRQR